MLCCPNIQRDSTFYYYSYFGGSVFISGSESGLANLGMSKPKKRGCISNYAIPHYPMKVGICAKHVAFDSIWQHE